ncbi:MAG: hypothetical protein ACETVS_02410 [Dehalococcoidales bacterium]
MKPILIILLAVLALTVVGCEGFEGWTTPSPAEPEEKPAVEAPSATVITTEDRAVLAVYEHLLSQAGSYQAKLYLADFYTTCDNWVAEPELLKDGTSLWYVTVDMTDVKIWREKLYWRQARWLIFKTDGRVVPSNSFKANALRIEADLQELSLQPES